MFINFLYLVSTLSGLLFLHFRFIQEGLTEDEETEYRLWYHTIWARIDNSHIKSLPNLVINSLWNFKDNLIEFSSVLFESYQRKEKDENQRKIIREKYNNVVIIIIVVAFFSLFIRELFFYVIIIPSFYFVALFSFFFILFVGIKKLFGSNSKEFRNSLNEIYSISAVIFLLSSFITGITFLSIEESYYSNINIRLISLLINLICDSVTIIATLQIFKLAKKYNNNFVYLLAVLVDLVIAAILAFLTLYLIVVFTPISLNQNEIYYTLIGKSITGDSWEINQWFWLMHTTFIPTLIYLIAIFSAVMIKLIVIPTGNILGKASVVKKPNYYLATAFAYLGGIALVLARFLTWYNKQQDSMGYNLYSDILESFA